MYQQQSLRVAPGRTEPEQFDEGLAFFARRLRFSVADLDDRDRQLLADFGRGASRDGEVRYRMLTVRHLCAIAGRSNRSEDREALPELIRAEILRTARPQLCLRSTFDEETAAVGPADVAQRAFEKMPTTGTWVVVRDALMRQMAATRFALDAVLMWSAAQ